MRVLLTSWAWPSHFLPLVPLGLALRCAGHEVVVAGQPSLENTIRDSGLIAAVVGRDVDSAAIVREQMGLRPDADGDWSRKARTGKGAQALSMFATFADAMVDDLIDFGRAWGADAIVYETTTYAGPLAAAELGVPGVRHLLGLDFTYAAREFEPEVFGPLLDRLGLDGMDALGAVTVDPCPPSLQIPRDGLDPVRMRYMPSNGPGVVPSWLLEPPSRPRVCVTWGTSLSQLGTHLFLAGDIARAIDDADIEVVIAIAKGQRDLLGEVPENARVVESLPLNLLLPSCDLLVHQGGQGTMLTGMALGVPQLVIPQMPDQWFTAKQFCGTGAGRSVVREECTPERIRGEVAEMLRDRTIADAAGLLRKENDAAPPPAEIVPVIEGLR